MDLQEIFLAGRRSARFWLVPAISLVLIAAQSPEPSPADSGSDESIIVTGKMLSREEISRRATEFVRGTRVASGATPAARWIDRICLRVVGLGADQAGRVEAVMLGIAREAGVAAARPGCRPNVAVAFTRDAGEVVRTIERQSPRRLAEVPSGDRAGLLAGSAPIRWWYSTEVRGRHGARARAMPPPGSETDEGSGGGGSVIPGSAPTMMHYESSTISTLSQRVLTSATIVIDADGVSRFPLEAVASFAALVALAEIKAPAFAPEGSILGLFGSATPPRELTGQDKAFLLALYRLPLDRQALRHRGLLVREMVAAQTAAN